MPEQAQYDRLAAISPDHDGDIPLDSDMWANLYEYTRDDAPEPDLFAEITHAWGESPEGWGSTSVALLARLTDGRWATCVAWSDTSGFDCQGAVDWRTADTRAEAIAMGLDKESRVLLGLPLPGEGSPE